MPGTFDHDRLDVYRLALDFVVEADALVWKLPPGRAYLADQLHRAATSVVLNIAEGAGEYSRRDKARFYRMAKRSATECAAIADVFDRLGLADPERLQAGKLMQSRIVAMLVQMVKGLERPGTGTRAGTGTRVVASVGAGADSHA